MDETKTYVLWMRLMKYGKKLGCHQLPERSFFVHGYQFPVCARCTGVIISSVLAIPIFFIYKIPIDYCIILGLIMFFDWFIQYIKFLKSNNYRRLLTGIFGGIGITTIELYFVNILFGEINEAVKYILR